MTKDFDRPFFEEDNSAKFSGFHIFSHYPTQNAIISLYYLCHSVRYGTGTMKNTIHFFFGQIVKNSNSV